MGSNQYEGLDDYAVTLIRHKARQLVGHAGFVEADRPDLEQELVLDLLRRLPRFDPAKAARNTFIARVIRHRVATLVEAQKAGVRDYRRVAGSLDERRRSNAGPCDDVPPVLQQHEFCRTTVAAACHEEDGGDLRRDVSRVVANLPFELRDLCERLLGATVTEVSRETGVPRSTLYGAIGKLRQHFDAAGLAVYLDTPTDRVGHR